MPSHAYGGLPSPSALQMTMHPRRPDVPRRLRARPHADRGLARGRPPPARLHQPRQSSQRVPAGEKLRCVSGGCCFKPVFTNIRHCASLQHPLRPLQASGLCLKTVLAGRCRCVGILPHGLRVWSGQTSHNEHEARFVPSALTVLICQWRRCGLAVALLSRATRRSSMAWPVACHAHPGTPPPRYTVCTVLHCLNTALHTCAQLYVCHAQLHARAAH